MTALPPITPDRPLHHYSSLTWISWVGVTATLAMILASMAMNALFLHGHGRTLSEGAVFVVVSIAADALKAVLPVMIAAAWSDRRFLAAGLGVLLLLTILVVAFASALGYAAENRGYRLGTAELAQAQRQLTEQELDRLRTAQTSGAVIKGARAIEEEIAAYKLDRLWTQTRSCTDVTLPGSVLYCRGYRRLTGELADVAEQDERRRRIAELERRIERLVAAGAGREADAQASLISRWSGWTAAVIRDGLVLAIALLVELGSAFGLLLCHRSGYVPPASHNAGSAAPEPNVGASGGSMDKPPDRPRGIGRRVARRGS